MISSILKVKDWYERYERFNPFVFFFGGFTWDSLTLKRIDQIIDNVILLIYLILLGILLILTTMLDKQKIQHPFILKHEKWIPLALQFLLGGLFSAYVVFYFQSASLSKTALFLGLLALLLIANEFLEKRLQNLYLLLAVYFLACFSFFIFFIPVVTKILNVATFILGGVMSLLAVLSVIYYLFKQQVFDSERAPVVASVLVVGLYASLNVLYFFNWIPPVPLSLKFGGIYHHASKSSTDDTFVLRLEQPRWYQFFKDSDNTYHYAEGDTVSCFTAVFAPAKLHTRIFHHWQKYFAQRKEWLTTDRLGYQITGYREGGYRGLTRKRNVSPGTWRVDVETAQGVLLGRVRFDIEPAEKEVTLKTIYR